MTTTDRDVADHHAAGALADELPYWGWLPDERTCLTRRGELVTLARLTPTVVDGHTPEQLDAVLNRWQRMLSGIDARTRMYVYLLRRPAIFPDADTGLSAVADLGQRKRRAFLGSRIQQIETYLAWCYDPKLSTAAAGKNNAPWWKHYIQTWMTRRRNPNEAIYFREQIEDAAARFRQQVDASRPQEIRLRVEAVNRWYVHDWNTLDNKIRSSIVEGVSVFLSMFDLPAVARVFCPPAPDARQRRRPADQEPTGAHGTDTAPLAAIALSGDLPPLDQLIERGKVLALNMPAGTNPALSRAIGVMLKNAWLQSLLRRPATMKREPGRYVRPAVFICDEYQAFASVGEDDPSGDEKAFALTRQCRVIPIVATQSISSLRSVLGSSEAWRTLLQTLRTRIFLSLSDEASAEIASKLCGQVAKIKSSYTINESARSSGINLLSAQAGGGRGSVGASKSFQERREALFQPRDFALLGNCQAICLPYDGVQALPPRRVYLKPHYLPADLPYWTAKQTGQL